MKKILAVILAVASVCVLFCSCGAKLPSEEATTELVNYNIQRQYEPGDKVRPISIDNVDFVLASYYVYGKSYAEIEDVIPEDYGMGDLEFQVKVNLKGLTKSDKEFKIGYKAYDKDGTVISDNFILVPVKDAGLKQGDTFDCRFKISRKLTVKTIEFYDYTK